jgi:hypothetical protein
MIAWTLFLCFDAEHTDNGIGKGIILSLSATMDSTGGDVIRGALCAWGILGVSAFLKAGDRAGSVEIHDDAGRLMASVWRETSPIGWVWHIGLVGRRERVFPSVVTALRYLRGYLCPEREAGRVLFGQGENS